MTRHSSQEADLRGLGAHDARGAPASITETPGEQLQSTHRTDAKDIPAAVFAALVGRDLRTLSAWDKAGITHPEVRCRRRYYGTADIAGVLKLGGRKGPREGSLIKYISADWDSDT